MKNFRLPPWIVLVCLAVLCAAVIGGVGLWRASRTSPAALMSHLPAGSTAIVYLDFRALRNAGVLGLFGSNRVAQEPEYRSFVDQTGFDYQNDLDSALVAFHSTGTYFLLRGRFDWKNLKDYIVNQGGSCYNTLCKVNGSTPQRKVSYYPFSRGIMALAVATDDTAASVLQERKGIRKFEPPSDPVWALIPGHSLKASTGIPAGLGAFVRGLDGAESVIFSAGPEGRQFALHLDAVCASESSARAVADQLRETTARLRDLIAREHVTPNARDLSGVLAAGAFEQKETHVLGRWPVERTFLENLGGNPL